MRMVVCSVVDSFSSGKPSKGIPLGNLTSQLFINIYLNEFDQYVKRVLKIKYYIRYADDFVILFNDRSQPLSLIPILSDFLHFNLKLDLHPQKLSVKTVASGVDFLGWVHFPDHRVLRTSTKRRTMRAIEREATQASISSYLGLLKHGNARKLEMRIRDELQYKNDKRERSQQGWRGD